MLFHSQFATCQNTISGKVVDESGLLIFGANIILFGENRLTIGYTQSDEHGNYKLEFTNNNPIIINATAMGYGEQIYDIEIKSFEKSKIMNFTLSLKSMALNEVFVRTEKPIIIKNDTIVFNAKSFLQGNEQVVEDLLRKIPGLNIDENGTIKVGNQEVEKIMIDGDDMFEKGYKILTKNMPVQPIEKVELYQHYSNNKLLKGVENSNKVALNLTLKEDSQRIWFGNFVGGYGLVSENRYEVKANLMNFGKKSKHYFLTNLNNIGTDATGDINDLIRPYRTDEPGSIGDNQSANTLLNLGSDIPDLQQKRTNLNNAEMLSLNSIFTLSDRIKLKTLGFLNTDEVAFFRNSLQTFSVGNTTFTNTEDFIGSKTQITGLGKLDLTYDLSKTKTFEYIGKFNNTNEKNRSDLLFNNDLLNERLNANNQLFDHKIVYTNKFKENKVLLLSGRYINEKTPQTYTVNQFIFNNLFTENANNTNQFCENKMQFAGFESHLLDKKQNGDLLEIKIGNQYRKDNLNTTFKLLQDQTTIVIPNEYQNNLTYVTNDLYGLFKYLKKLQQFKVQTEVETHQIFNQIDNIDTKSSQMLFFIVPKIGLDWQINQTNKIKTSYVFNTTNATIKDIYAGFVQTGFRSFEQGFPQFNQLNSSTATLNYTNGSWGDRFFANTFCMYSKNNDFFSTNSTFAQNFSQSEKIIIKDRAFLNLSTSIDYYFKFIKSNLKLNFGGTKTNFKNVVNNSDLREVKNLNINYGLELRSGFRGFFNYHLGSKWNYNQIETLGFQNSFIDNTCFVDLSFIFNDKFNIQLQTERYFFGNLEQNSSTYYFLDLETRYILKENKITVFLSGNNLFNTEKFTNFNISDVNISQTEFRLIPRYVLLKMEYRF